MLSGTVSNRDTVRRRTWPDPVRACDDVLSQRLLVASQYSQNTMRRRQLGPGFPTSLLSVMLRCVETKHGNDGICTGVRTGSSPLVQEEDILVKNKYSLASYDMNCILYSISMRCVPPEIRIVT